MLSRFIIGSSIRLIIFDGANPCYENDVKYVLIACQIRHMFTLSPTVFFLITNFICCALIILRLPHVDYVLD